MAGRVENLYDLMDAAYDSIEIRAHCILLDHKPIIDVNPGRSVDMQEALRREKKARRTLRSRLSRASVVTSCDRGPS